MEATQAVLDAIATPRRREILRLVWDDELTAGEIAARFEDVSWPAVSQNLGVLMRAGLLSQRREGNRRIYRARRQGLGPLAPVLRQMWVSDLGALKRVVESEHG